MYARKRLDIGWLDLGAGLAACATAGDRDRLARDVENWFERADRGRGALACLSVRSGLDLALRALALPRGSEVLVSALTIPDMWKVLEHHGLVPVPLDVDPRTLAPRIEDARAASGRTRALLVAHLFGTRVPLAPWARLARERGWLLFEDCAQAFTGPEWAGEPDADLSMFSFGPIKTAAALAGGVLLVRDAALLARMRELERALPVQPTAPFARRIVKYAGLKAISTRAGYALFVRGTAALGKDHDVVIQGSVRGFAGGEFFEKIRHRPSAALCALMLRRLRASGGARVRARAAVGEALRARVGRAAEVAGDEAPFRSHWVLAVACDDPDRLVALAREDGFDATRAATLRAVPPPPDRPELAAREAERLVARLVYLPVYPELPERAIERLAEVVRRSAAAPRPLRARGVGVEPA